MPSSIKKGKSFIAYFLLQNVWPEHYDTRKRGKLEEKEVDKLITAYEALNKLFIQIMPYVQKNYHYSQMVLITFRY